MRLLTDIPQWAPHLDLDGQSSAVVSAVTDAMVQSAMIRTHQWVMGCALGRPVTELEAATDWVDSGLARSYRNHYRRSSCGTTEDTDSV